MKLFKESFLFLIVVLFMGFWSCQEWDKIDPPAGNQKNDPPTVDPSYSGCSDPTIGKEGNTYYIISSNAEISGIVYNKGLVLRTTGNLVDMVMTDETAYVLNDVITNWAGARILALDPSINLQNVIISHPNLKRVGSQWRLYYTVHANTKTSLIGYAVKQNLAEGQWEDRGEVLSSTPTSNFKASNPSFCESPDGTKHYLAYGNGPDGVHIIELSTSTGLPVGSSTAIANRIDGTGAANPELFYYGGYYHLLFTTYQGAFPLTGHAVSVTPVGPYRDVANRSVSAIPNFWNVTRVITNHTHANGVTWEKVDGMGILQDGVNNFIVHHATTGTSGPTLHIRKMEWLMDSRRVTGTLIPVPCISPERYAQNLANDVSIADIPGVWHYGTLWGHVISGINYTMTFNADGTYNGGSWDYNPSTKILHLVSREWGNEHIYVYLSKGNDWTNDKAITIVGAGINDSFGDYPGVWMKKQGTSGGGGGVTHRKGVFDPSMARDTKYWVFSSNAGVDGFDYQKGVVVKSSSDLVFFDERGYVLSNVIDSWAGARLKALDPSIEDDKIVMGQPNIKKAGSEWRLYYSVQAGTKASVIGYATSPSLENPSWTDKGEILFSNEGTPYKAMSPSFLDDGTKQYLVFGENFGGVYLVEIEKTSANITGTPVRVVGCSADTPDNQRAGSAEIMYYNGYYHIIATYNNLSVFHSASATPAGPYFDFGNRNLSNLSGFADSRILTPYEFSGGSAWSYTDGLSICVDGTKWFAVHHARKRGSDDYDLHVRSLTWLEDSRIVTTTRPFPTLSPERYGGGDGGNITAANLVGAWHYGTLWYQFNPSSYNGLSSPIMEFQANGTYIHRGSATGGTWEYNETTKVLRLTSSVWGGEKIFLKVNTGFDWDKGTNTIVASGVNDTFFLHPGVWMKKEIN